MGNSRENSALLILAHGSSDHSESSQSTWEMVDRIRETNCFGSVHAAFWKEEPGFRQIYPAIEESIIYAVPNFISEGYFTRQVLPRELDLDGPVTKRDGKTILYCDPVGIHHTVTDLILQRAKAFLEGAIPLAETALFLVGHGTALARKSRESVEFQTRRLKDSESGFADVIDVYLEEAPFVADWQKLTDAPNVVVVPFFVSDGMHSSRDIPDLLGIGHQSVFEDQPHRINGRQLFYSQAIGTDPAMTDIVLDQVRQFDKQYPDEIS